MSFRRGHSGEDETDVRRRSRFDRQVGALFDDWTITYMFYFLGKIILMTNISLISYDLAISMKRKSYTKLVQCQTEINSFSN